MINWYDFRNLQAELISSAENVFGKRDSRFTLREITFSSSGPRIWVSLSEYWVHAELSLNAKGYFPTAIFEMAHEAVHILNPSTGYTNFLEEGVAVEFQRYISPRLSGKEIPITIPLYIQAAEMVRVLSKNPFNAARRIRERYGALGAVRVNQLETLFPNANKGLLRALTDECRPR